MNPKPPAESSATARAVDAGILAARRKWQPYVWAAIALLAVVVVVAGYSRAGLSWDGSYILFSTLHEQQPLITHARVSSNLLLAPSVGLSQITDNLNLIAVAFSLLMATFLPLSLWGCWRLVRHHRPDFILWPAMGITLIQLPGQFFFASEALIATTLTWILVSWIAVDCPGRWRTRTFIGVLTLIIIGLHPTSAILLLPAAGGLAWRGWLRRGAERPAVQQRWWWIGAGVLALAALLRMLAIENTGYEQTSSQPKVLWKLFLDSSTGRPMSFLLLALAAGGAAFAYSYWGGGRTQSRWEKLLSILMYLALLVVLIVGLSWAATPHLWAKGLDYRSPGPIFAASFMALSLLAPRRSHPQPCPLVLRTLTASAAAICLLVISTQAWQWHRQLDELNTLISQRGPGCSDFSEQGQPSTALSHWSIGSLSAMLQSRQPQRILMPHGQLRCRNLRGDQLPIAPYRKTPRQGWFQLP